MTVDQFAAAYEDLEKSGMKGLIIDVRSNPGGLLTSVLDISRKILPKGLIVYTEDKYGQKNEYSCDGKYIIDGARLIICQSNAKADALR